MHFSFNHQDLALISEIPTDLARYIAPGGKASALTTDSFKMLVQEFDAEGSKVFVTMNLVDKRSDIEVREDGPFLMTYLALQEDRNLELEGLGKILIREGQYNMLYAPAFKLNSAHEPGKEYITLGIQYDISLLEEWAQYFPALAVFINEMKAGTAAVIWPDSAWLTKDIQDTVYKIMHPTLDDPGRKVYFSLLVKTLLFHLMNQSVQQLSPSKYSHYEVEGIQAAGEMIRKNLRYHYLIREIAQKVGMNEFKLKNGFRELFGNGVYEYLRTERMQAARNMLVERGRSIKEIAAHTGYHSVNSFIKAFKKKYNQTPGEFRKSIYKRA